MADEYSRFHDAVAYTDVNFAEAFSSVHLDGVDAGLYNGLAVTAASPNAMTVKVATGRAWVQGRWYYNDAIQTLTIEAHDASYTRYDRIILRSTVSGSPGNVRLAVLKGTAAASPALPALTQTASVWEIPLATITITTSTTAVSDAIIVDARQNLASGTLGMVVDGGGVALTATVPSKGLMQVPFNCKVIGWTVLADQSGSVVCDVKRQTVATWPATTITTASIAGSDLPTLSTKQIARSFALTGWTTTLTEGDLLEFYFNSVATITRATFQLHFVRTN